MSLPGRALCWNACALGAALALLPGCGDGEAGGQGGWDKPPVVEIVEVQPEHVRDVIDLTGQLESVHSVTLKAEISGLIEEVSFEEGGPVQKGQPLFHLRDAEQQARLHEAQAQLALAKAVYERTRALKRRDAESSAQVERAEAEYQIARARLELARVDLERTVIRAPFDGVMGARQVSVGERVSGSSMRGSSGGGGGGESTGLARIDSLDPMELLFTLPETIMALARPGVSITLHVASFPNETFSGEIYFIDPRVNATNRRVLVKARVPNPEHKLRPGMFAKMEALVAERADALMVPEGSVMFAQEGTWVWRVNDEGMPERVEVELGIRQPGRVEITSGLRPGDRVVGAGTHKVSPGRAVRSVADEPAPPDASAEGVES